MIKIGKLILACRFLEQAMGIEPTTSAWEADVLPLNYACITIPSSIARLAASVNTSGKDLYMFFGEPKVDIRLPKSGLGLRSFGSQEKRRRRLKSARQGTAGMGLSACTAFLYRIIAGRFCMMLPAMSGRFMV